MEIVEFLMNTSLTLIDTARDLFDFMIREWDILGTTYTTAELLFGGAVTLVLGWNFTKWLIGLD